MIKLSEIMKRSGFVKHNEKIILKFDVSNLQKAEDVQRVVDYFISMAQKMPNNSIAGLADLSNLIVTSKTEADIIKLADLTNHCFTTFAVIVSNIETKYLANKIINSNCFQGINAKMFETIDNANNWISSVA